MKTICYNMNDCPIGYKDRIVKVLYRKYGGSLSNLKSITHNSIRHDNYHIFPYGYGFNKYVYSHSNTPYLKEYGNLVIKSWKDLIYTNKGVMSII